MNSVHEPGSRTMSKNRLRNSTESNRVENRPSAQSAQPVASPRAQLPGQAPAAPCRACAPLPRSPRGPHAPLPPAPPAPRAYAPSACPAPARPAPSVRLRPPERPARPAPQRARLLPSPTPCRNTAACLTTQAALSLATVPHNTIFVLRYKLPAAKPPTIQILQYNPCPVCLFLQYNKLYCNTVSKPTTPILQYNPSLN